MIPIRDINPSRNFPLVNTALIGINVVVFLLQMGLGNEMDRFIYTYGLVPARYSVSHVSIYFTPFRQVFFFIGFWFVLQLLNAAGSHGGGTAWWAHIGGFLFGIVFLKMALKMPSAGVSRRISPMTARKKTPRLQVIRPGGPTNDPNLYGTLVISPFEARLGSRKLVNIPWGFQKRLINVTVPPGIKEGKQLKLKSLGKLTPKGGRGDLFLKVEIK